ncbi:hypothetical protein TR2A62_1077 [Thalassobium sp. R2A62]|nr:hypothetical protein TR2A62_1077 [Thalassobium sp. R2A62]
MWFLGAFSKVCYSASLHKVDSVRNVPVWFGKGVENQPSFVKN